MIRIRVAAGYPSLDFFISDEMNALAVRIAARNHCTCFVGVRSDGSQILSTDREELFERDCQKIAWIHPEGSAA